MGERFVMVNIPSFSLRIHDHGADVATMRVVVGKPKGHETPIFSDVMETVVGYQWQQPGSSIQLFFYSAERNTDVYRSVSLHYRAG